MQKTISYIFLVLISSIYSYETISCFSKSIGDVSIALIDDFQSSESSGTEKSNEKNESSTFDDDLYLNYFSNNLISKPINSGGSGLRLNSNFSSFDFSQKIYTPPKL